MDKTPAAYFVARCLQLAPWIIGLVGLNGILCRLGRIPRTLEQIRDQQPTGGDAQPNARVRIPGLND